MAFAVLNSQESTGLLCDCVPCFRLLDVDPSLALKGVSVCFHPLQNKLRRRIIIFDCLMRNLHWNQRTEYEFLHTIFAVD
jgi:hypothetical protein